MINDKLPKPTVTKTQVIREIIEVNEPCVPTWVPLSIGILIALQISAIIYITMPTSNRRYERSRARAAEEVLVEKEKEDSVYWSEGFNKRYEEFKDGADDN